MAKTYRKIQQWDHWLAHFPGEMVLETERKFLPHLLTHFYGNHVVLIGTPHQEVLLQASVIPNKTILSPLVHHTHAINTPCIETALNELPIASGSIDLVLIPHILEHLDNPRQLLAEACRIVRPEGHIIICGFNPYSLWGLKKLLSKHKNIPWSGNFLAANTIKKWLQLADFALVKHAMTLFRPPVMHEKSRHKYKFIEWLSRKCFRPFGGAYVLIAQAKVIPLTPIKLRWKQPLADARLSAGGIPRPSTRNPSA